eukprot:CAMPEP_0181171282 /NCGR_PEP_ID=MMETSP1096-20121128/1821_1 /TAXON_ID=156174 ORGANISM="Chrysochromulina ericina, Strain CCMP281" /NCGR_SAMPLE_ID=MMETSP1096 /ASSEMBLY_ACC=CAM_ASM_000453 /LENGTH=165 /DNA_ID=CAMNT_0023258909 /DNA_START=130 /DNA_END=628 /DNA_ORIENTATION=-
MAVVQCSVLSVELTDARACGLDPLRRSMWKRGQLLWQRACGGALADSRTKLAELRVEIPLEAKHTRAAVDVPSLRPADNVVVAGWVILWPGCCGDVSPVGSQETGEVRQRVDLLDGVRLGEEEVPVAKEREGAGTGLSQDGHLCADAGANAGANAGDSFGRMGDV